MKTGQEVAKPPVSPRANLTTMERAGVKKHGGASWRVTCTCGFTVIAAARDITHGSTYCRTCNMPGAEARAAVLAAMPASYAQMMLRTKMTRPQVEYRIKQLRKLGLCHIGNWKRAKCRGLFSPVFYAGPGEDVPCHLTRVDYKTAGRAYRKRVKKAVEVAMAGGKADPRYIRHIASRQVTAVVRATRATPQSWFSALIQPKEGAAC